MIKPVLSFLPIPQKGASAMPLTRVSLRRGKSAAYRQAILDGIYRAMRETFDVPEDDRFMTISEHDAPDFDYGRRYLGIERSDDLVLIQLTVSNTRSLAQKKALYRRIVERLAADPGLRPEDVFINLVEVRPENWSFGHGIAQYAEDEIPR
jgi:4-oxalocrotonate tautomerase